MLVEAQKDHLPIKTLFTLFLFLFECFVEHIAQ